MADVRVRFQAARWVVVLGRLTTAALVVLAIGLTLVAAVSWSLLTLVAAVLTAGLASAWHALVEGFVQHRRGAWAALLGVAALDAGVVVCGWVLGGAAGPEAALGTLHAVVTVVLLLHPDTRDWVSRPGAAAVPARSGPGAGGLAQRAGMPEDHRRRHAQVTEEQP